MTLTVLRVVGTNVLTYFIK